MERHIPYEKLSKKQKKALNAQQRGSWGGLNPVTRRPPNPKAYQRSKARNWKNDSGSAPLLQQRYAMLMALYTRVSCVICRICQ